MPAPALKELDLENLVLEKGAHESFEKGVCVMEAVAFVAGEPHSDHPQCACPIIGAFMRVWNDDLDNAGRQQLKPYIPKLVGTKATKEIEQKRGLLLADWMLRVHTPAWLELGGMKEQADKIRALPELGSWDALAGFQPALNEAKAKAAAARAAARDAAWAAAWDAARAAAWDAARAAARDAAWAAAWAAAWDAAWAAAWDAAWAAAWDAARAAAWAESYKAARKKLEPTQISLQASAFQLLDKLIALGAEESRA